MTTYSEWQYDETQQVGADFADIEVVAAYDAKHRKFRKVDEENAAIIRSLQLQPHHVIADFGCGTGAFAIQAARHCAKVYAVDVSAVMLQYARQKADDQALTNIVFCHGGFLTYDHPPERFDAINSTAALHHLPDFWKQVGLNRLSAMLKEGGRFHLMDVVFSDLDFGKHIEAWLAKFEKQVGSVMGADARRHVRQEHSTFTWIMEGLLERAGFRIDTKAYHDGVFAAYDCTKVAAPLSP